MTVEPSDALRGLEWLTEPDPRWALLVVLDGDRSRPTTQQDRWESISRICLDPGVPAPIHTHFETARNLYLYAWFAYRFHVVAEQQALATLEFALRERSADASFIQRNAARPVGLKGLMTRAAAHGLITNERLWMRDAWARGLAKHRTHLKQIEKMTRLGLAEMVVNPGAAEPTQEEYEHDWIGTFVQSLPDLRNQYAHGTSPLHANVLRTLEVVSELVNQLYTVATTSGDPSGERSNTNRYLTQTREVQS